MNISKSEFKIIFNKMMSTSNDNNRKMISEISDKGKTGNNQIDAIINNYSSEYIAKIMTKIINRGLVGGQTSEDPKDDNTKPKQAVSILSASETSIIPPSTINIIDKVTGSIDKPSVISKSADSTTSSDVFMPASSGSSGSSAPSGPIGSPTSTDRKELAQGTTDTSSAMLSTVIPSTTSDIFIPVKQTAQASQPAQAAQAVVDSATSSAMLSTVLPSTTSDIFIPAKQVTQANQVAQATQAAVDSATSSAMPLNINTSVVNSPTSTENITTTDAASDAATAAAAASKKAIELVTEKNILLNEKEKILRNKEEELKKREEQIIQSEQNTKLNKDKIDKEIEELKKTKIELESSINKLKEEIKISNDKVKEANDKVKETNNKVTVPMVSNDQKIQSTESEKQNKSIFSKIFGK